MHYFTLPNQCLLNTLAISFRALCGAPRTRSTFRAAGILSDKGNLCDYVDNGS